MSPDGTAIYALRSAIDSPPQGAFGGFMANWVAGHTDHFVGAITTPMLVIHGNRVPYSESLRAFWELVRHHGGDPETLPHRFLQFTGENHFVLSPGNARIWNETVLAFLEWHVLRGRWSPPRLA